MKQNIIKLVSLIAIFIIFLLYLMNFNAQKIVNNKALVEENEYKEPEGFTFIEGLGYSFLTAGLSYNFGVSPSIVEDGFNIILSTNFTEEENKELELNELKDIYSKQEEITKDKNNREIDDNDKTISYMIPKDITKENIKTTSNAWLLNYRFYKDGLTGLKPSYWYSGLFKEDIYFDRAWNSLKWMCKDLLNGIILEDESERIEILIYSDDVYWELYLDKLYNIDIFKKEELVNCISMKVDPIKEEEAINILREKNIIIK